MKTAILIPARYASTRYPGKPLAALRQADGTTKTLIQMTWEAATQVPGDHAIHVCTDDDRIREAAEGFGASVLMTSSVARNGTERCAEALAQIEADLVVNLQGDAPLTPPWFLTALIERMQQDSVAQVATPVLRCDRKTYDMFVEDRRAGRVGGTTAVFDRNLHGLYFSKEVIPYIAPGKVPDPIPVFHHVGVYAYRPAALQAYMTWPEGVLEAREGLEQLRFLENGTPLACVEVDARGRVFWELNNPEDIPRIEAVLGGA
ncbi:3-deoxy-manno-octulosonate cytidylyltransferase [Jannaschia seohaensis]|uniref:3-deoxy-manno-octulosonate cytidylyltransferase (CMP-KDO synthetase) n=1 Tax=Jannaschia seohaensis TaxID=475081 RepID=A0A2Y9AVY2_9RHOB|nr:manno-octulosonate cytidylyltransferase [Jannaschia seohaensis]PWJ17435.1 3-deoxy-manno-octulosonate cytidylyltransferase (CMP-KDO synthetase) [Jannaschia seohaensis]SSA47498.1 3-deoxy-manno-octulosonate cytidylyltransferase (CMP-KDO synthetase) [Jannaschia seohaensis]